MKKQMLYWCWAGWYLLCAGLGFLPSPQNGAKGLLVLAAVLFFLPGGILLGQALQAGDRKTLERLRNLSALALGLALGLLALNILSIYWPQWAGQLLHVLLVLATAPMVCGQYWVLSLFLWAALLMGSLSGLRKLNRKPDQR